MTTPYTKGDTRVMYRTGTGTVASERTASSRSGKVEALSSNRAARIAQSDQSRVSTAAFRARVEDVEGGDRQMQQCPLERLRAAGIAKGVAALEAIGADPTRWDLAGWNTNMA